MKFKTVWVSDIHLGSRGCQAEAFTKFLDETKFDTLIMNGDIIDGWRLKSKWFFPQEHVNATRKVLSMAKKGRKIYYVTGNHDEFLRGYHDFDMKLGNIEIVNKMVYKSNGKSFLVVHGDGFDNIMHYHKWVAYIGDVGYNLMLSFNSFYNKIRGALGYEYWSISKYLKHRVKEAANFMFKFEETAATMVHGKYDGVICGHIHHPEIKMIGYDNTLYLNSGDWVETCSWIGETEDGILQVWEWNNGTPILLKEYRDGEILNHV